MAGYYGLKMINHDYITRSNADRRKVARQIASRNLLVYPVLFALGVFFAVVFISSDEVFENASRFWFAALGI